MGAHRIRNSPELCTCARVCVCMYRCICVSACRHVQVGVHVHMQACMCASMWRERLLSFWCFLSTSHNQSIPLAHPLPHPSFPQHSCSPVPPCLRGPLSTHPSPCHSSFSLLPLSIHPPIITPSPAFPVRLFFVLWLEDTLIYCSFLLISSLFWQIENSAKAVLAPSKAHRSLYTGRAWPAPTRLC